MHCTHMQISSVIIFSETTYMTTNKLIITYIITQWSCHRQTLHLTPIPGGKSYVYGPGKEIAACFSHFFSSNCRIFFESVSTMPFMINASALNYYCMSNKSSLNLFSKLLYELGQDFLGILYSTLISLWSKSCA